MDFTLQNGKIIPVDVSGLSVKEYRTFTSKFGDNEQENIIITKCTGLTVAEIEALNFQESRSLIRAILTAANQPLNDPNLASASTKPA